MKPYDVVWYWVGGAERGQWAGAPVGKDGGHAQREDLVKLGYVSKLGRRSIGPPETPPTREELDALQVHPAEIRRRKAREERSA